MADQIEKLIKEIAEKHGIVVSRDDPILMLQTVNFRLLQDSAKAQQVQLDRFKLELEALALRWGNDSKGKAERVIIASLQAGKAAMEQAMQEAAVTTATAVGSEIEAALTRLRACLRDAQKIAVLNIVGACIAMGAAAVALWAGMR
jgi:hypothetical protein